jgi:hypothetical protein
MPANARAMTTLLHVLRDASPERNWARAVGDLADMTPLDQTRAWLALYRGVIRGDESLATSLVKVSECDFLFRQALQEAEERRTFANPAGPHAAGTVSDESEPLTTPVSSDGDDDDDTSERPAARRAWQPTRTGFEQQSDAPPPQKRTVVDINAWLDATFPGQRDSDATGMTSLRAPRRSQGPNHPRVTYAVVDRLRTLFGFDALEHETPDDTLRRFIDTHREGYETDEQTIERMYKPFTLSPFRFSFPPSQDARHEPQVIGQDRDAVLDDLQVLNVLDELADTHPLPSARQPYNHVAYETAAETLARFIKNHKQGDETDEQTMERLQPALAKRRAENQKLYAMMTEINIPMIADYITKNFNFAPLDTPERTVDEYIARFKRRDETHDEFLRRLHKFAVNSAMMFGES